MPDQFWDLSFYELGLWRKSIVEKEKLEWRRVSAQMSLLYNINRGKNKQMSAADFFPWEEENGAELKTSEDVKDLAADVEKLRASFIKNSNDKNG